MDIGHLVLWITPAEIDISPYPAIALFEGSDEHKRFIVPKDEERAIKQFLKSPVGYMAQGKAMTILQDFGDVSYKFVNRCYFLGTDVENNEFSFQLYPQPMISEEFIKWHTIYNNELVARFDGLERIEVFDGILEYGGWVHVLASQQLINSARLRLQVAETVTYLSTQYGLTMPPLIFADASFVLDLNSKVHTKPYEITANNKIRLLDIPQSYVEGIVIGHYNI